MKEAWKLNRSFGSEPCAQYGYGAMFSLTLKVYLSEKLKIIIIEFYKIVKILRAPWLVKKKPLIAPINPWKIEVCVIKVTDGTFYRFTNLVNVSRCWETIRKKKTKVNQSPPARNYKLFEARPILWKWTISSGIHIEEA